MDEYSMIPSKGCTLWKGLLLTASLLTCWYPPAIAQITIELVPTQVNEGEDVLFLVHDLPAEILTLAWFKGEAIIDNGIAFHSPKYEVRALGNLHTGRETMYRNGSLWIRNVTQADTGIYTLGILTGLTEFLSKTSIYLFVNSSHCECPSACAQPTIESVPPSVAEGKSVLLVVHNLPKNLEAFYWYKGATVSRNNEVSVHRVATYITVLGSGHSGRETLYSNGSLLIQNVTWNDIGFYTLRTLTTDLKTEVFRVQLQLDTSRCVNHPASAQTTIESVPPSVVEGGSALLVVHNLPKNILEINWFKGTTMFKDKKVARNIIGRDSSELGPAHSGRETVYSNGSLLLQNVTKNDAGFYTLQTLTNDLKFGLVHGKLLVETPLSVCCNSVTSAQLTIEPVPQNAVKGDSVLLLVHNLPEDLRVISWYKLMDSTSNFKVAVMDRLTNNITQGPAFQRRAMVYTNGSLLLQDVMESDAGIYSLHIVTRDFKSENAQVQLNVYPCRLPPANVQLSIEMMPPHVVEGQNALLLAHNIPENLFSFSWSKEATALRNETFAINTITTNTRWLALTYSGRVTVYPNGSLLLHNTTQKDTGLYIFRTLNTQLESQETPVYLHIYKPVTQPLIQITSTTVTAHSSVVLTCISSDTGVSIRWIFNNRTLKLTGRMTLSRTKCQLRIDHVRRRHAGKYQCEVFNPVSSKTSLPVSLVVMYA